MTCTNPLTIFITKANNVNSPQIHIDIQGSGADVIFLHGWGMNSGVYESLKPALQEYRVHFVDLPGFGHSAPVAGDIHAWAEALVKALPKNAIWLGWSLGGLVASYIAIHFPASVKALITVASSPCFMAQAAIEDAADTQPTWPGIAPNVLTLFIQQLQGDLSRTIERFLAIQAMGSESAKADISALKAIVMARPLPNRDALVQGLLMLEQVNLRHDLHRISQPWLRIWGKLDSLVPRKMIPLLPQGNLIEDAMLAKASHAPFISHPKAFLDILLPWLNTHS